MQFDRAKLKAVILHTCARCESPSLGAVKLHKVLYFADMLHYAQTHLPITGATYRKRAFGPTCDQLLPMLRELEQSGALLVREVDYFGYRKKEFQALAAPEADRLNENERNLLDEVIDFVCKNNTAKTISELSHNRAWEIAQFGEALPYHSAFHLFPSELSEETVAWADEQARNLEEQRAQGAALDLISFEDFQNSVSQARS